VCCSPQNEHIDIKKFQAVMPGLVLKDVENAPKFMLFFFIFFITPFLSRQFLRNYYRYKHNSQLGLS